MTLALRKGELPHDLQYCLDGAIDAGEITAAADIAIRLYGETAELDRIWNESAPKATAAERLAGVLDGGLRVRWQDERRGRALAVERYGLSLMMQVSEQRRRALVTHGFSSLCRHVVRIACWLADANYEDETKGGCIKNFRKRWRLKRNMRPPNKLMRRLNSPKRIRHYLAAEEEVQHLRQLVRIVCSVPLENFEADPAECDRVFDDLNGQLEEQRLAQRRAIEQARFMAEIEARGDLPVPHDVARHLDRIVKLKPGVRAKIKREKKQRHRALKRATMLAAAFLGASAVSAFARGEPVRLANPDAELALSARLAGPLHGGGHGALRIDVHGAGNAKRLASLCLYQEAPALDQLVSLAMHMQAGALADVLDAGNLFAVSSEADAYPALVSRKPRDDPRAPPRVRDFFDDERRPFITDERAAFDAGKAEYVGRMTPLYAETIATIVFGPCVRIWRAYQESLPEGERYGTD